MKTLTIALTLIIFGLGCNRSWAADEHAWQEGHAQHEAPALSAGQLWPTDEPLRAAMAKIRSALERAAPAFEGKELRPADAQALAVVVEESVAYMVANCRLAPAPDAALHALIGRMMSASEALTKDPESEAGVPQLLAVMRDYGSSFDHPGWAAHAH